MECGPWMRAVPALPHLQALWHLHGREQAVEMQVVPFLVGKCAPLVVLWIAQ